MYVLRLVQIAYEVPGTVAPPVAGTHSQFQPACVLIEETTNCPMGHSHPPPTNASPVWHCAGKPMALTVRVVTASPCTDPQTAYASACTSPLLAVRHEPVHPISPG